MATKINNSHSSYNFLPIVEAVNFNLEKPSLDDNVADWDRLTRFLQKKEFNPVTSSFQNIRNITEQIRQNDFSGKAILSFWKHKWELIEILKVDSQKPVIGAAFDLGTTRIALYILDLKKGTELLKTSIDNPQIPYGEDILTRIVYASSRERLEELHNLLINSFNSALQENLDKLNIHKECLYAITVAGNTTMSHFFTCLNPSNICKEPYIPAVNRFPLFRASEIGLYANQDALVYVFPNVGSYFGGDIIAGIIASEMHRRDEISMLIDVGTNAEIVLGNKDWMIACAGAAGPALEGGVVERGMMALPGAIDWVRIDPESLELSYHVIGDKKPVGICGSGLIDLIAEMFQAGLLTIQGKINLKLKDKTNRIIETDDGAAFVIAWKDETGDGQDLIITDIDIGILLKSKAAMYTILNVICRKVGLEIKDVNRIYIAGTFGNHINPEMAIRIGMLPDLPLDKFVGLGNTSGIGASKLLFDRTIFDDIDAICDMITYIELNVNVELMHEFRGALFIPHTDPKLFPSVKIPELAMG